MAQWVEALAAKADDLSLTPEMHTVASTDAPASSPLECTRHFHRILCNTCYIRDVLRYCLSIGGLQTWLS